MTPTDNPSSQKRRRLERLEAQLIRWVFTLASFYAFPALLMATITPTLDLVAWATNIKIDWTKLKGGGIVFSLIGFIALGGSLVSSTFSYASNSKNKDIALLLSRAAKSLYTCMITILSMIAVAFALNFYSLMFQNPNDLTSNFSLWDGIATVGMLLMLPCTALAALKFQHFIVNVMQAIRLEANEG